jgi:hypothetical protein
VNREITVVHGEITVVHGEITVVQKEIEEITSKLNSSDLNSKTAEFLQKEKADLRRKEGRLRMKEDRLRTEKEQLRRKKEQMRAMKLLALTSHHQLEKLQPRALAKTIDIVNAGTDSLSWISSLHTYFVCGTVYRSDRLFIHRPDSSKVAYGGLLQWASSGCGNLCVAVEYFHGH